MDSQDVLRKIFLHYARGDHVCWGVEVQRFFPQHTTTEYLVPNTFKAWHDYVDAQPEFLRRREPKQYGQENINWVKDKIEKGEVKVTNYVLYIDAYYLLKTPTRETMRAMNALFLNLEWRSCPIVIFNIWDRDVEYHNAYLFTYVPHSLFYDAFGHKLSRRPHNLTILYNAYERPHCAMDFAKCWYEENSWDQNSPYFSSRLTEVQARIHVQRGERADAVHPPQWYARYSNEWLLADYGPWDIVAPYTSDDDDDFKNTTPIAGCYRWNSEIHRIRTLPTP